MNAEMMSSSFDRNEELEQGTGFLTSPSLLCILDTFCAQGFRFTSVLPHICFHWGCAIGASFILGKSASYMLPWTAKAERQE